jgi:hypothetical protein
MHTAEIVPHLLLAHALRIFVVAAPFVFYVGPFHILLYQTLRSLIAGSYILTTLQSYFHCTHHIGKE